MDFEPYAEVLLPLPLPGTFTYRISAEQSEQIQLGGRVLVPFGKGKFYTGIVTSFHSQTPDFYQVHYIQEVIDKNTRLIELEQLKDWEWIARYYMSNPGDVMQLALPAGLNLNSLTYVEINKEVYWQDESLPIEMMQLLGIIDANKKISIKELEKISRSKHSLLQQIKTLYHEGLILLSEDIQSDFKPKVVLMVGIHPQMQSEKFAKEQLDALYHKLPKHYEMVLRVLGSKNREITRADLLKNKEFTSSALQSLVKKNILLIASKTKSRIDNESLELPDILPDLTDFQENALLEIEKTFQQKQVVLLHAPTAGGKTLIYAHLLAKCLQSGKQALLLVPEIALTQQLVERLEGYFPGQLFVTHSKYSKLARTEVWLKVRSGNPLILVGPRSTALLPFQNLGLVIVDEEHENTFKQFDRAPRFNGKDFVIRLAARKKANVLLGSATPSIESYYQTQIGKWGLVQYQSKFGNASPATIYLAPISSSVKIQGQKKFISAPLDSAIKEQLAANKQVILFQNRKGYVPVLECGNCQWTPKCNACDIPLTYYKYSNNLRCHYCGFKQDNIKECEACHKTDMRIWGYGTERIEEEISLMYPGITVKRFDQDSVRNKESSSKILQDFENRKIQLLVGTQLVAKGIDFSNVGLCAVVSADPMLNLPDFRAGERTFQLLVQLAGRAGRRDGKGTMIIQSGQMEHPVLQFIRNYDYAGLYAYEIQHRKNLFYPPFRRLIKITVKHKDPLIARDAANALADRCKTHLGHRVLGPEQPLVSKVKNFYLQNILLKLDPASDPLPAIKKWIRDNTLLLQQHPQFKSLQVVFDVDP